MAKFRRCEPGSFPVGTRFATAAGTWWPLSVWLGAPKAFGASGRANARTAMAPAMRRAWPAMHARRAGRLKIFATDAMQPEPVQVLHTPSCPARAVNSKPEEHATTRSASRVNYGHGHAEALFNCTAGADVRRLKFRLFPRISGQVRASSRRLLQR